MSGTIWQPSKKEHKISHIVLVINGKPKPNSSIINRTSLEKIWIHFLISRSILFKSVPLRNHLHSPAKVLPPWNTQSYHWLSTDPKTHGKAQYLNLPESPIEWLVLFFFNLLDNQFQSHREESGKAGSISWNSIKNSPLKMMVSH